MAATRVIERGDLDALIQALRRREYQVIAPVVRDQAVVLEAIASAEELPIGFTEEQDGGHYRLVRRGDRAVFGFSVGPKSFKQLFFPPAVKLWRIRRKGASFEREHSAATAPPRPRYALFGARACDLAAVAVQDRIFLGDQVVDPVYAARRAGAFVVAVQCGQAGGTCFCVSMNTGPRAERGFDLALTEILAEGRHLFAVEVGTDRGAELLADVPSQPIADRDRRAAEEIPARTAASMGRTLDTANIRDLLMGNLEHPRWDEVAGRCLSCANCTLVCPTCFCSTVQDTSDVTGDHAERWRRWDSCFSEEHSYVHGGVVRGSIRARYRQWLTHKLATWIDQFGTSGCVGCGRCITWCPVGIDITEEVRAIREDSRD